MTPWKPLSWRPMKICRKIGSKQNPVVMAAIMLLLRILTSSLWSFRLCLKDEDDGVTKTWNKTNLKWKEVNTCRYVIDIRIKYLQQSQHFSLAVHHIITDQMAIKFLSNLKKVALTNESYCILRPEIKFCFRFNMHLHVRLQSLMVMPMSDGRAKVWW